MNGTQDPPQGSSPLAGLWDVPQDPQGPEKRSDSLLGLMDPASITRAKREAYGAEWWGEMGKRTLRGLGDAELATVDTVTRGYAKIGQWAQYLTGFEPSIEGKGVVQRLTGQADSDSLDALHSLGLLDDPDGERTSSAAKLGNTEVAASVLGNILSFVNPAGPTNIVGRGAQVTAESAAKVATIMAGPVRKAAERLVREGKWTAEQVSDWTKKGQLMDQVAKAGGWGERAAAGLPKYAGEYGSLVAQSYASAPQSQQQDVLESMATGALLYPAVTRVAKAINQRLLDRLVTDDERKALLALDDALAGGDTSKIGWALQHKAIVGKGLVANALQAAAETAGFSVADPRQLETLLKAYGGDPKAQGELVPTIAGTFTGIMAGKLGLPLAQVPYWRRLRPELNTYSTLRDVTAQQNAEGDKALLEAHQMEQEQAARAEAGYEAAYQGKQEPQRLGDAPMDAAVTPLMRSGWLPENANLDSATPSVDLSMPGVKVQASLAPDGSPQLRVPSWLWFKIRPGQEPPTNEPEVLLTKNAARSFITDLGMHSTAALARSALRLGRNQGFFDTGRGSWRNTTNGTEYQYGLDGKLYSRDALESGKWEPASAADTLLYTDTMFSPGDQYWDGALESWSNFLQQKQRTAAEPEVDDAIALTIMLAQHGGETPQARGARALLGSINPHQFAQALRPDNSRALAHSLLSIGAGMASPDSAVEALRKATQAPSKAAEGAGPLLLGMPESMVGDLYSPERAGVGVRTSTIPPPPQERAPAQEVDVPGYRGPAVDIQEPSRETKGRYLRDDDIRKWRARQATAVQQPVTVQINANTAQNAQHFFPKKSKIRQALESITGTGGSVTFDPADVAHFADSHARWAPKRRQQIGEQTAQPQIQSIDTLLSKILQAAGLPDKPPTGTPVEGVPHTKTEPPAGERVFGPESGAAIDWVGELARIARRGVKSLVDELGPELRSSWRSVAPESRADIIKQARTLAQRDRDENDVHLDDLHGEAGAIRIPTRGEVGAAGERVARATDPILMSVASEVGRHGGEVGREYEQAIRKGSDFYREQHGAFEQAGIHDFLRRASGRKGFGDAVRWLEEEIPYEGHSISRANLLLNGKQADAPPPEKAQQLLDEAHKFRVMTGEFAEQAGTLYQKSSRRQKAEREAYEQEKAAAEAAGQPAPEEPSTYARRTASPDRRINPRVNLTDEYFALFDNPFTPQNEAALRELGKANKIKDLDDWISGIKKQAQEMGRKGSPDRTTALEHARELDFVPDTLKLPDGTQVPLQRGVFHDTMLKTVERAVRGNAAVKAFGQDFPEAAKKQFGITTPGPKKMMERMRIASQGNERAMKALRAGIVSLEGEVIDQPLLSGPLGTALSEANTSRRALMLSGAFIPNVTEFAGSVPVFAGFGSTAKALVKAGFSPRRVLREALDAGAILRDHLTVEHLDKFGLFKRARRGVTALFRATQRFTEAVAFDASRRKAESMRQTSEGFEATLNHEILRGLDFTPDEIATFLAGNATPAMERDFVRRSMAETVGNETPSERSRLANNRLFNAFFDFQRFYLKRARVTAKLAAQTYRASTSGDPKRAGAAWGRLLTFFGGSTLSGLGSTLLGMMWREWSFKEGWDQFVREWEAAGGFAYAAKKGLLATLFGGVARTMYEAIANESRPAIEQVAQATSLGRAATHALQFARSEGPYRDQNLGEKLVTFGSRAASITKDLDGLAGALGIATDTNLEEAEAIARQWRRDNGRPPGAPDPTADADLPFVRSMRKIVSVVRAQEGKKPSEIMASDKFRSVLQEALGVSEGKDIARSLQGRRILDDLTPEDLESLGKRAGQSKMRSLYQHDQALKMIAESVGRSGGGTARRVVPEVERRLAAAEEASALGGSQVWKPIYQQAMDESVAKLEAGQPSFDDLFSVADTLARHPDQLGDLLSDKQSMIAEQLGQPELALYLRGIFAKSAVARAKDQLRKKISGG